MKPTSTLKLVQPLPASDSGNTSFSLRLERIMQSLFSPFDAAGILL